MEHFDVVVLGGGSAGAAFFSGYSIGDKKLVHSDLPIGQRINTTAGEKVEYGFEGSVQYEFFSWSKSALLADARYSRSVTQKDHEDADHCQYYSNPAPQDRLKNLADFILNLMSRQRHFLMYEHAKISQESEHHRLNPGSCCILRL